MAKPAASTQPPPEEPPPDPKAQALARHNTLHAHPDCVTDPLFASHPFFDPRDLLQVKYEMLRRVHTDGVSITEAVQAFGLSRPTFYDAQAEFEAGGLQALVPHKKGPRRASKMTPEVMAAVTEILQMEPRLSPAAVAQRLSVRYGVAVHGRSVARALERPTKKA